jgi:hypothetical protein
MRQLSPFNRTNGTGFLDRGDFPAPGPATLHDPDRSRPHKYRKPGNRHTADAPYFGPFTIPGECADSSAREVDHELLVRRM